MAAETPSKVSEKQALADAERLAGAPKASPKCSSKTRTPEKTPLKRPAARRDENQRKTVKQAKALKRPASNNDSTEVAGPSVEPSKGDEETNKSTNKAKKKDQEKAQKLKIEEPQEETPDPGVEASTETADKAKETRDYAKAGYFHRNFSKLPEEVQKAFQGKDLNREKKTQLVNQAVQKDSKGSYTFNLECQAVKMLSTYTEKTKGSQRAVGMPKSLMISKLGSEQALQKAMADGEVSQTTQAGRVFYVFNTIELTRSTEAASTTQAEKGTDVSDDAFKSMNAFVSNFLPSLSPTVASHITSPTLTLFGAETKAPTTLALTNESLGRGMGALHIADQQVLTTAVLTKIDEALTWWTKAREQARKQFSQGPQGDAQRQLRQHLVQLTDRLFSLQTKLEHVKMVGTADFNDVKDMLTKMGSGLVEVQETLRALSAMG
ncbi:unnamed protein product [Cladocopium goreaui]|uniref:Uncharacterized protein n=1 Tax=Cladocopium goreaui TaxID=2562237 RepID=A0A9P1D4C8_9DINO|nr:unnamed protein product [Cladocopium goreaui]